MSIASTSVTVYFTSNGAVYSARMYCDKGDLFQDWKGSIDGVASESSITSHVPDFETDPTTRPTVYLNAYSSKATDGTGGRLRMYDIQWQFGGTNINFDLNGDSTGVFAASGGKPAYFHLTEPAAGETEYQLTIQRNIVVLANFAPSTISATGKVSVGTQTFPVTANIPVSIRHITGANADRVVIEAGDNKIFQITEEGGSCILRAAVYSNGVKGSPAAYGYEWFIPYGDTAGTVDAGDGWYKLVGQTGSTLTVTDEMVAGAQTEIRVKVYNKTEGPFEQGDLVGSDIQTVFDTTDEFDIVVDGDPENMTIDDNHPTVLLTPHVISRSTGTKVMSGGTEKYLRFRFMVLDGSGVVLNHYHTVDNTENPNNPNSGVNAGDAMDLYSNIMRTYTVTRSQVDQAGGPVSTQVIALDNNE